jgi:hypothetical protein
MNTAAKVAIGCVVAAVGIAVIAVVAIGALGYWATGKVKEATQDIVGDQKKMTELQEKANAHPFTAPADGSITEPRLLNFLEVRKRVYDVYLKNKAEIDAFLEKNSSQQSPSLSDITRSMALVTEARQARLQGLADVGMNEEEYMYYAAAVYASGVTSEIQKSTGGQKVSEAVRDKLKTAAKALEEVANATPDPSLSPEAQKMVREAQEQARQQQLELEGQAEGAAVEAARTIDVPEVNVMLFRKHEAEIKKYAMGGLEFLGI